MVPIHSLALLHPVAQVGQGFTVHLSTVIGIAALAALYEWSARRAARAPRSAASRARRTNGSPASRYCRAR